jgi:hypothetical protein
LNLQPSGYETESYIYISKILILLDVNSIF